ncbi:hypothetical protein V3851_18320 [Paenibacillus sp. M1]|uniref:Uncharacterized protein n=1 Tax=Paenibacillus haidiansis TaxID=1574488 RepID=A0ABU7VWY4_9BACL
MREGYYTQKIWSDSPSKNVEDYIGEIIKAIFAKAEEKARLREQREAEKIKREIEREEKYKAQLLKEKELSKVEELIKAAQDYKKAKVIREFVNDLSLQSNIAYDDEKSLNLKNYIQWASHKADWLDPLIRKEDELLGKRHGKWIDGILYRYGGYY